MSDVRTVWRDLGGDWVVAGPSLAEDDGLETAVVLSLFTDRVAAEGDTTVEPTARRGWWGDAYPEVQGDQIGSRLWQLAREKQLPQVLARAELYAREALQWLVDDGVASSVAVQAEQAGQGLLGLAITITRSAQPVIRFRFESFWKGA
jgi:phage gp46-like protein